MTTAKNPLLKYSHTASIGSLVCTGTTRLVPSDLRQSGVRNHVLPRNLLYGESNGEQQCLKDSTLSAMDTYIYNAKFLFFPGIKQNVPLSLLGRLGTGFSGKHSIPKVKNAQKY